jgi:hypothetical protein
MNARAQDRREYIRLSVDLPLHPKLVEIDEPAAGWLYVTGLCYAGQHLTDGEIPPAAVVRLAGVHKRLADRLVEVGLWHRPGHDCPGCPQPRRGHVIVHDYLEHQRSAGEAKALRDARREAGSKGAAKRWAKQRDAVEDQADETESDGNPVAEPVASAIADATHGPQQTDSNPMPEGEVEGELLPPNGGSSRACGGTRTRGTTTAAELAATASRPDAYRLVTAWRDQTGAAYRPATIRALAKQADGILRDGGALVPLRAALDEWNRRAGARPGLLPHLYDDAVKAARLAEQPAARPPVRSARGEKVRGWLALAAEPAPGDAEQLVDGVRA